MNPHWNQSAQVCGFLFWAQLLWSRQEEGRQFEDQCSKRPLGIQAPVWPLPTLDGLVHRTNRIFQKCQSITFEIRS